MSIFGMSIRDISTLYLYLPQIFFFANWLTVLARVDPDQDPHLDLHLPQPLSASDPTLAPHFCAQVTQRAGKK